MSSPGSSSLKTISLGQNSLISEKVRRIDGVETVRQYTKRSLLGTGGFANCYLTESVETGKLSATKVVSKSILVSQRTKMRLFNEIRLHKALHHPNVVQFQHCFQDSENVYIFLELCSNQSLSEVLQTRLVFTTPEIQSLMYGIINGVKYLHSKQIIHRDLKLGNIFLNEDMNIKIGDLGLATKLEFQREYKRTVCGTPNFIAPEVLEGKGYHFEVDIWSIGVIMYALYFGVAPFQAEDANSTYIRIKDCNYTFPRNHNAPKEAVKLIQAIFVRNPASRPTINQILEHPFFALGNGVYKSLPSICSKRIPTQKQLQQNSELIHCSIRELQVCDRKEYEFVKEIEEVLENVYYYKLSNTDCAILYPNSNFVLQTQTGVFMKCSLATNTLSKVQNTTQAANLLLAKQQFACCQILKRGRNSTIDLEQPIFEENMYLIEVPVHVRNVMHHTSGIVIELSHGGYQLRFNTKTDYLITKDRVVLEITPRGIKTLQSNKKECAKQRQRCPEEWAYVEVFVQYLKRERYDCNQRIPKLSHHNSSIV